MAKEKVITEDSEVAALIGKYLTFELKEETYGLDVMKIMQIIGIPEITPIPRTPEFVKGVINLRGKIIPVIDLRLKFEIPLEDYTEETAIIVVDVENEKGDINIGIIVDRVSDVLDIHGKEIEITPSFGVEVNSEFILGMAKIEKKIITLLDINRILTSAELVKLQKVEK